MKLSVVVNAKGEIVGASIPSAAAAPAGARAVDEFRLPAGHKAHEVAMPPELEKAFLDGAFVQAFQYYRLVHESGGPSLKRV
jgi:hypothetical protein